MSKIGVSLKIDVSKIEKARLFQGQKGTYLDATVFIDIDQLDQYGNSGMITQDVSKQEKDNGAKGAILGNCKVFWNENPGPQTGYQPPVQQQAPQQGYQQPPQQAPQQSGFNQQPQKINPQEPVFDQDIPF